MSKTTLIQERALSAEYPLAFFCNGYGDNFINLPALRALCRLFAGRLTLVCRQGPDLFCFDDLPVKRRITLDAQFTGKTYQFDAFAAAAEIGQCDLFLSLVPWSSPSLRNLLETWRGIVSIGFFENYTRRLRRDYDKPSADLAFDIVRSLRPDYQLNDFLEPLRYPTARRQEAHEILSMLEPGVRTLSVHMDTLAHKRWDESRWIESLDEFLDTHADFVALLIGRPECPVDTEQWRNADRVIPCYGLSLPSSCCLVAESDFFIGIDSCMLHVADMARVPGVGLFGPTSVKEFGFYIGPHIMIQAAGSMGTIEVSMVTEALHQLVAVPTQAVTWRAS
ncbi:MAG TPA: glycosyltransferase family 9 protein [Pyrinomonadaceae bacterium]|nr:glycosyltransferase family 9 protein [Pyrinomonadaceae bacterium]